MFEGLGEDDETAEAVAINEVDEVRFACADELVFLGIDLLYRTCLVPNRTVQLLVLFLRPGS